MAEFFEVTSISRGDLEALGYKTDNITDDEMKRLASKMADDYLEQMYWISMNILAEDMGFEKEEEE